MAGCLASWRNEFFRNREKERERQRERETDTQKERQTDGDRERGKNNAPAQGIGHIGPVSYTHLTLPTRRTV